MVVRDVKECYDYGMRTEGWLRKGHLMEGRVCAGVKDGEEGECSKAMKEEAVEGDQSAAKAKCQSGKC